MWHRIAPTLLPLLFVCVFLVAMFAVFAPDREASTTFRRHAREEKERIALVERPLLRIGAARVKTQLIGGGEEEEKDYRTMATLPCALDLAAQRKKVIAAYTNDPSGALTLIAYYPEHDCSVVAYVRFLLPHPPPAEQ